MPTPLAAVTWNTSHEELVDVFERTFALPDQEGHHLRVGTTLLAGAAIAAIGALRWLRPDGSPVWQAAAATVTFAGIALLRLTPGYRKQLHTARRRHMEARLVRRHGDGECPFTVELHPSHLATFAGHHGLTMPWSSVRSIEVEGADLVIQSRLAVVVVPGAAFHSHHARKAFTAELHRLAAGAQHHRS